MARTDDTGTLPFATLNGVSRLSALEAVRARIALAVDLGLLAPGDRLPSTADIAAGLEVGEITVRRALVSLVADGVLERRRGRNGGTHVAENPTRGAVAAAEAYRSDSPAVHALIDHRLVLECGIAHLASGHVSQDNLSQLQDLVEEMDRVPSWAEFHGCDERFHLRLAEATGIPSLTTPYGAVLRELYRYYLPYPLEALRASNTEHRRLLDALRRKDAAEAGEVARRHVEVLHRTMFVGLMNTD
ncbi:FCD domain-containing protein [Streptomyces sp. LHD-70]|uniref:FadR/GntR family transcriptional regulator n=1 Tax=Streptomyces sp. LHD-70 TaxID=3072140 RepID=UPI00280C596B|nr:FCD domain-containing protein [Streptomyces sp. LHD-70]MDQ8707981.1 FCD domain-containing protein [Streptomyces sp. LHD-70]